MTKGYLDSMQYTVHYIADKLYGTGIKRSIYKDGMTFKPPSQVWVCPICAETMMQVSVLDSNSKTLRYIVLTNECEYCGSLEDGLLYKTRITLPGSILMEGFNTIDELSDEMLRRELLLELNAVKFLITKGIL
jgi:hypothetical protein